jgi:N-acetylglucosamine kinase-like BadF-type ATPase
MSHYVVGIDGGGTKTTAEVCTREGELLATAVGAPSNFQVIGVERASEALLCVLQECCARAGVSLRGVDTIVAGLSGAGREPDQKMMERALKRLARTKGLRLPRTIIESDAMIALEGAFSGKPGIILIVGTGSIAFGKDERGVIFRAGGWGRILGDEGSGYWIGREALRMVARVLDGDPTETMLLPLLARRYGLTSQQEIIRKIYRENFDIASVAPLVIEAAQRNDTIALQIVRESARHVVFILGVLLRRMRRDGVLNSRNIPVAVVGSLGGGENVYSGLLRARIRRLRGVTLRQAEYPPVRGASLMAISLIQRKSHRK